MQVGYIKDEPRGYFETDTSTTSVRFCVGYCPAGIGAFPK
jgi:hypothetical protein